MTEEIKEVNEDCESKSLDENDLGSLMAFENSIFYNREDAILNLKQIYKENE